MGYHVNGKNLSVARLMVRGKADKRMKYLHVGPKGVSVVTPIVVARVSLPGAESYHQPFGSAVIPQDQIDKLPRLVPENEEFVTELPEGEAAITGPNFLVPQIDKCIPEPGFVTATFTCNGDLLRKLLTVACEVSKDSEKTLRLRICGGDMNTLRIDNYRQPGDQEFVGVLKGIDYDGDYIPGELPSGTPKIEKKPEQTGMLLKVSTGRKFK